MSRDRQDALESLASSLADAWRTGRKIALPPSPERPKNRAEAYLVQDRMAELIGEPVMGWKAGATSENMRRRDGHDDIVPGRAFASRFFTGPDQAIPVSLVNGARIEPEFAFRINETVPVRREAWSARELAARVTAHIAVELIGSRYREDTPSADLSTLMTIADNGNGVGLIIGEAITDPDAVDFHRHPIDLSIDGGPFAPNSPPDIRCSPFDALVDIANHLSARGIALETGSYITTGSATETVPVIGGTRAVADFGRLGRITLDFSIPPLGQTGDRPDALEAV
jgi:2-keto-4-pentenoate hydratase